MAYQRALHRRLLIPATVILFIAIRLWQGSTQPVEQDLPTDESADYYVVRVVDGDTIIVSDTPAGTEDRSDYPSLRLLGIDTPETVKPDHPVEPFGPEASAFTKDFLSGGIVRLQFDRRRVDKYGRMLAYVYVGEEMLNEALCRAGLARVFVKAGDSTSMARQIRKAEEEAKRARRGIWSGE